VVEMQLAHSDHNKVRKADNHAKYLPQRCAMMQSWADYVDALRDNTDLAIANRIGRGSIVAAMKTIHHYDEAMMRASTVNGSDDSPLDLAHAEFPHEFPLSVTISISYDALAMRRLSSQTVDELESLFRTLLEFRSSDGKRLPAYAEAILFFLGRQPDCQVAMGEPSCGRYHPDGSQPYVERTWRRSESRPPVAAMAARPWPMHQSQMKEIPTTR